MAPDYYRHASPPPVPDNDRVPQPPAEPAARTSLAERLPILLGLAVAALTVVIVVGMLS